MASIWGFILYSGFFPFIASVLLVITPYKLRRYTHRVLSAMFFFDFWTGYPIIHAFLAGEGILLAYLIKETMYFKEPDNVAEVAAMSLHPKSKQWRGQRNCYAVAWAFTSWWYVIICSLCLFFVNVMMM